MDTTRKIWIGALLTGAICSGVGGAEVPDRHHKNQKIEEEFKERMNSADTVRPHLFLDHNKMSKTSYIMSKIHQEFGYFENIAALSLFLKQCAEESDTGFALPLDEFGIAVGNKDSVSGKRFAVLVGNLTEDMMRDADALTTEQANRFTMYHEGTHSTQGGTIIQTREMMVYQRSLDELRADIGGIIGMARDEGNFNVGKNIAALRSHSAHVGMMNHFAFPMLFGTDSIKMYDNGKELEIAINILKARENDVMNLKDGDIVTLVDDIYNSVKPSFDDYIKKHNILKWSIAYTIGAGITHEDGSQEDIRDFVEKNPHLHLEIIENIRRREKCRAEFEKNARAVYGHPMPKMK